METQDNNPSFGLVHNSEELGQLIRSVRKQQHLTLERVAGISNVSMRFLSELERGKQTAELGKVLQTLQRLGLEIIIQPRGYKKKVNRDE